MGPIRDVPELDFDELPHPPTLCTAMDRLTMALRRRLLQRTTMPQELGAVTAIDASSFYRIAASRRYARRTEYRFLAIKTILLVDSQSSTILDLDCTARRPHDTQIGWQVLTRNLDRIRTITADKGFDWVIFGTNSERMVSDRSSNTGSSTGWIGRITPDWTPISTTVNPSSNRSSPR